MASLPLEQAEVVQKLGPLIPRSMETCPEAMSVIIMGTRKGLIRDGPLSRSTLNCSASVISPPMPLPITVPTSPALSSVISRPDWAAASRAAMTANWTNRSIRRAALRSRWSLGLKSETSAAMWVS